MRSIPSEIRTLLKTKSMLGANAPTSSLLLLDKGSGWQIESWVQKRKLRWIDSANDCSGGSFVKRADGKTLVTYQKGYNIMLAAVDNEIDLFTVDNLCASTEWIFYTKYTTGYTNGRSSMLQRLRNGKILLYIYEQGIRNVQGKPQKIFVYESAGGNGTDFIFKGTAWTFDLSLHSGTLNGDSDLGHPIELDNGRLIFPFSAQENYISTYGRCCNAVAYSDDGGSTWIAVKTFQYNYCMGAGTKGIAKFGTRLVTCNAHFYSGGAFRFTYSDNNGSTWIACDWESPAKHVYSSVFWGNDGFNYMLDNTDISTRTFNVINSSDKRAFPVSGQEAYSFGSIGSGSLWEGPLNTNGRIGDDGIESLFITDEGRIAVTGNQINQPGGNVDGTWINGADRIRLTSKVPIIEASVSRDGSAQAQRLTATIPNVNPENGIDIGFFSPEKDSSSEWYRQIWPGKNVQLEAGYGTNMVKVFTGCIDVVNLGVQPGDYSVKIDCRDGAWNLLDKSITDGSNYFIKYKNKTIEFMVSDLLQRAGFEPAIIHTEPTGITIKSKQFERMNHADAIEWLLQISGFELTIDEEGKASFHRPNDRQPSISNEAIVLTGAEPAALSSSPIVSGSEKVTGNGGTPVYVREVDYSIDYAAGTITRKLSGAIPDGSTVYAGYVFAAWKFKEGEDLFFLDYTYARTDIYGKIRVTGKKPDGSIAVGTYSVSNSMDSYGVPQDKVLFIEDENLDTDEKCQKAADQLGAEMVKRFRVANVSAVAVPWLQVGDCIQVIETSTSISEIYRILNMEFDFSTDGFIMTMKTYHCGYTPVE